MQMVPVSVEMSAVLLQVDDQSEVRHRNHGRHLAEHAHHVAGASRAIGDVLQRPDVHQRSVHRHIHIRVYHEIVGSALVLLQGSVECVRLRSCSFVYTR